MKKLLFIGLFSSMLLAYECNKFLNQAFYNMSKSNRAVSFEGGIYYEIRANNFLKLFTLCHKYGITNKGLK